MFEMWHPVKVLIKDVDDGPVEPDICNARTLELQSMIVMEKATKDGDTGVYFKAGDGRGETFVIATTGHIFRTLCAAFRGADERFKTQR